MRVRLGSAVVGVVIAISMLAVAAPAALAASWDVSDATHNDVGYVSKVSNAKYVVKKDSGTKVGVVVKTSKGWQVKRGTRKIAVLKNNGNSAYPVNMYQGSTRVGRCGPTGDGELLEMDRCAGNTVVCCLGFAAKGCPARVALGAARLLLWY
jgi:hypothetical protein